MECDLDGAIAGVYGGPLETFVQRRDALAKELRAAGRKDDAAAAKGLRKPSRMAWALDVTALAAKDAIGELDAAVAAMLEAHAAGGDARGAIAALRSTVREFAARAARTAEEAGHRVQEAALANAVLAVLGKADALSALRRGCLIDVPEAGGLDLLASLPAPTAVPRPEPAPHERTAPSPSRRTAIESTAREAVRQARLALADASERSEEARRALREVEAGLETAEEDLRQAEAEVRALRGDRDRAQIEVEAASARQREAGIAVAEAESQLASVA
jgi:hypothetical protein